MAEKYALRLTLEQFVLVAYVVPVERVRPLLTSQLEMDTVPTAAGDQAVISTWCGRLRIGRTGGRAWKMPLGLAVHAACVKRETQPGLCHIRSLVAPPAAAMLARLAAPAVNIARSAGASGPLSSRDDQAARSGAIRHGLESAAGRLEIEVLPGDAWPAPPGAPVDSPSEGADDPASVLRKALTDPRQLYFWLRGRYLWSIPEAHADWGLLPASPVRLRMPLWQELGILSPAELAAPPLVCWATSITAAWRFPRPVWSI